MANWLTAGPKMFVTARKHEHEGQKVHGKRESIEIPTILL